MGFRSTFVTEDYNFTWPSWFKGKYYRTVNFTKRSSTISSKREAKHYDIWADLESDIQKSLQEFEKLERLRLIYMHECGEITKVTITNNSIVYSEPSEWNEIGSVTHYYCTECSET